jgi:predicted Zn-dependent protease with MMP-like domain
VSEPNQDDDPRWSAWDEAPCPEDEALDRAWDALDAGDPEAALRELAGVDADWPDRWIPEALARTQLGDLSGARAELERARGAGAAEDPDWLWAEGGLRLAEWRIDEAREVLQRLLEVEKSAAVLERLSLCSELSGDFAQADRLLAEARALDPEFTPPPRLEPEEFGTVVQAAIEELPSEFRAPLETTEVLVEPVPAAWMIDLDDPAGTPPDLLGLFVGTSDVERSADASAELPRRIVLVQRNLERAAGDREHLLEEIRKTLYHEIGHLLGFDEDGVERMGLE